LFGSDREEGAQKDTYLHPITRHAALRLGSWAEQGLHGLLPTHSEGDFDNDHLYGFFVARTPWSRDRVRYDEEDENGEEDDALSTTTLESLFPLPKDRKLFYLFDYGDNWIFQISRTRNKPFVAEPGNQYPLLIGESGEKPPQYPEPDYTISFV